MSGDFNSAWLKMHLARTAPKAPAQHDSVEDESDLHEQIRVECLRRGWLAFHGAMSKATHRTGGEPDFVILRDGGRLLLVECKSRGGKLSLEQQSIAAWSRKLGHTVHVVRSFAEFCALL